MKDLLRELLPPGLPPLVRWRVLLFISIVWLSVMAWGGYGALQWVGFPGFAMSSELHAQVQSITQEMSSMKAEVTGIKTGLLEQRIYDAQRLYCSTNTPEARRFYAGQVASMHREYFVVTGVSINIPTCKEVAL